MLFWSLNALNDFVPAKFKCTVSGGPTMGGYCQDWRRAVPWMTPGTSSPSLMFSPSGSVNRTMWTSVSAAAFQRIQVRQVTFILAVGELDYIHPGHTDHWGSFSQKVIALTHRHCSSLFLWGSQTLWGGSQTMLLLASPPYQKSQVESTELFSVTC